MKFNSVFVSEDTLTSAGEVGLLFLALRNQTDKERVRIREQNKIGKAALTLFQCKTNVKLRNIYLNL